ncbi:hypothetical protein MTO96_001396 [Rhipicephalus appendiculatus]
MFVSFVFMGSSAANAARLLQGPPLPAEGNYGTTALRRALRQGTSKIERHPPIQPLGPHVRVVFYVCNTVGKVHYFEQNVNEKH